MDVSNRDLKGKMCSWMSAADIEYSIQNKIIESYEEIKKDPNKKVLLSELVARLYKEFTSSDIVENRPIDDFVKDVYEKDNRIPVIAYVFLLPVIYQKYMVYKIDEKIYKDTMSELSVKMQIAQKEKKDIFAINITWLNRVYMMHVFKIGRLQYAPAIFKDKYKVFRNKTTGELIMLSDEEIYRRDGLLDGSCGEYDKKAWKSEYHETQEKYIGFLVDRSGVVERNKIEIDKRQWDKYVEENNLVVEIHIPEREGQRLNLEECIKSINHARNFFKKQNINIKAFVCRSWLMSYHLTNLLEDKSNIKRFQSLFYRYPIRAEMNEVWKRVYKQNNKPEEKEVEHPTSLQKKVLEAYDERKFVFRGGGICLFKFQGEGEDDNV